MACSAVDAAVGAERGALDRRSRVRITSGELVDEIVLAEYVVNLGQARNFLCARLQVDRLVAVVD